MAPLFSSRRQESAKVGARPAGQSCKAYSLVSWCKKASFGTRSPLPAPLPTHTYLLRVIRAKKFRIVPQKHSQIISAQKANPTGPLLVHTEIRLRQASTFSPTYPPFSSSLFISCPCSTSKQEARPTRRQWSTQSGNFQGRIIFCGNPKNILLEKTVTLRKESNGRMS